MLSESARMSSAAEARFRVQDPNSKPRVVKVVALDPASEQVVRRLAQGSWQHATFFTMLDGPKSQPKDAVPGNGILEDLAGAPHSLADEVAHADLFIMVATPGGKADGAALVGEACSLRRVMTTGLIVGAQAAPDEAVSKTLAQLRPWSLMTVIANPEDYIDDMLVALRA